jgi:hypothetical protein
LLAGLVILELNIVSSEASLHPSSRKDDELGDLARREAWVGESVSLFVVSPSRTLFIRKEGLGDVKTCLAGRALSPHEMRAGELE